MHVHVNGLEVCRHCKVPIMKFTFRAGEQYWHTNLPHDGAVWLHCYRNPEGQVAEP